MNTGYSIAFPAIPERIRVRARLDGLSIDLFRWANEELPDRQVSWQHHYAPSQLGYVHLPGSLSWLKFRTLSVIRGRRRRFVFSWIKSSIFKISSHYTDGREFAKRRGGALGGRRRQYIITSLCDTWRPTGICFTLHCSSTSQEPGKRHSMITRIFQLVKEKNNGLFEGWAWRLKR